MKSIKWLAWFIALLAAFWLGCRRRLGGIKSSVMDLGGGANHPDAGASFPICVLDVETYRQRHTQ